MKRKVMLSFSFFFYSYFYYNPNPNQGKKNEEWRKINKYIFLFEWKKNIYLNEEK